MPRVADYAGEGVRIAHDTRLRARRSEPVALSRIERGSELYLGCADRRTDGYWVPVRDCLILSTRKRVDADRSAIGIRVTILEPWTQG